jgi:hypothetical protein
MDPDKLLPYGTYITKQNTTFRVTIRGPIFTESGSETRVSGIRIQNKYFSDQNITNLYTLTRISSQTFRMDFKAQKEPQALQKKTFISLQIKT